MTRWNCPTIRTNAMRFQRSDACYARARIVGVIFTGKNPVKSIEEIEKHLETNRKTLLFSLRSNNWAIKGIEEECSRWDLDEKWFIQSERENRGFSIELLFCKHDGIHDGINQVVALQPSEPIPEPYGGVTVLYLDGRKFESRVEEFLNVLHQFRIGSLQAESNEKI